METTKIHLSSDELQLMQNEEWILTKNRIVEKLISGMAKLGMQMQQTVEGREGQLIHELQLSSPKISRGEKYHGLPYIILDYPRIFERENILAIRTLFWWGNFCSITLHVNGKHHASIANRLVKDYQLFQAKEFYVSISGNEWNHDLRTTDYQALAMFSPAETGTALTGSEFLKISAKVEFSQWDEMEAKLYAHFIVLLRLAES